MLYEFRSRIRPTFLFFLTEITVEADSVKLDSFAIPKLTGNVSSALRQTLKWPRGYGIIEYSA